MNIPTAQDIRDMKSLKHLVKYALEGDLKDHELWSVVKKLEEYGKKVTEEKWPEEAIQEGPNLKDMKMLTEKFMRMMCNAVGWEWPEDLNMGYKDKYPGSM